jgi:hypothetical protein
VDAGRIPDEALKEDSLAACLVREEKNYHSLNRAFAVWVRRILLNRMPPQASIPEVNNLEEVVTMLYERHLVAHGRGFVPAWLRQKP